MMSELKIVLDKLNKINRRNQQYRILIIDLKTHLERLQEMILLPMEETESIEIHAVLHSSLESIKEVLTPWVGKSYQQTLNPNEEVHDSWQKKKK